VGVAQPGAEVAREDGRQAVLDGVGSFPREVLLVLALVVGQQAQVLGQLADVRKVCYVDDGVGRGLGQIKLITFRLQVTD
jgi:hypothetical protein